MKLAQRHLAIPVLLLALTVIVIVFSSINLHRAAGSYQLVDFYGDRAVLDDVRIHVRIRDVHHVTEVVLQAGSVTANTSVYSNPAHLWRLERPDWRGWHAATLDGTGYQVSSWYLSDTQTSISYVDLDAGVIRSTTVKPRIYLGSSFEPYMSETHYMQPTATINYRSYGLTNIDEQIYFTLPIGNRYYGTGEIFAVSFAPSQPSEPIITFSLDNNRRDSSSSSLEVLGLEGAAGKLALVTVEDGNLSVRAYDPANGELLGEATLPQFNTLAANSLPYDPLVEHYFYDYTAYSDDADGILTLRFRSSQSTAGENQFLWIVIDMANGMRVIDQIRTTDTDWTEPLSNRITQVKYHNGRMYVISLVQVNDGDNAIYTSFSPQRHLLVSVYEQGSIIYQGEIVTDMNDDHIWPLTQYSEQGVLYDQTTQSRYISGFDIYSTAVE